jgi:hypothetical protein
MLPSMLVNDNLRLLRLEIFTSIHLLSLLLL